MSEKIITVDEFRAHTSKDSFYVLIHGKVYDATKFLDEHPGGDEVILAEKGKDATEAFEDVGHSDEARELLLPMLIGSLEPNSVLGRPSPSSGGSKSGGSGSMVEQGSSLFTWAPVVLLAAWFGYRYYTTGAPY
ncbi:unnamed protein product [Mycena citricolor]|uniref:Cytochrome b5 heme-binding domain-containing protein n=1 Tax=Mycena citricolor TaxID=2018698 RepID=A0AAD2HG99_9AGAR|nr:unnamed protein product [Mycena citricolor]CAK5275257.1 unnamed protein product [Mycena citricolor]